MSSAALMEMVIMRCPVCGTNGVEHGVCFYCEARKNRKKRRGKRSADKEPRREPTPPSARHRPE